jgi:gliding motility-associated lipoprotein GldH
LKHRIFIISFFFVCALTGCLPSPYFQKVETIPGYNWDYNFKPVFKFDITDTMAAYQAYFIIRHTQAYPFNNIWMLINIKAPGDTLVKKERVNIVLAEANGKWMGRGMGEIWEQRMYMKLGDSILFNKIGTYEVSFEQNMRINPLPEILNVGLRVERTGERIIKKK